MRTGSLGTRLVTGVSFAALSLFAMACSVSAVPVALVLVLVFACVWEMRTLASAWTMWPLAALTLGGGAGVLYGPASWAPWLSLGLCALGVAGLAAWAHGARGPLAMVCLSGWLSGCLGGALWAQAFTRTSPGFVSFNLVFVMVPCLWVGDTMAYAVGKTWGRHRLAPAVSPGKTWEGALGHLVGCTVCASSFGLLVGLPLWAGVTSGLVASVSGQAGDLLQSWLKRAADVKDSGAILPGHGGILDRIDSMLLAVPLQLAFLWVAAPQAFHVKP